MRTRTCGKMACLLVIGGLLSACTAPRAGTEDGKETGVRLAGLSPQSSADYQCGPSTLASVLAYHGDPVSEKEIAAAIYSPTARGTLLSDMGWYARRRGFEAEVISGDMTELQRAVDEKRPAIVLLDLGFAGIAKPHFTAVTGYTSAGIFQLGRSRPDEYISTNVFSRQWKRAGNMALLLSRPGRPPR